MKRTTEERKAFVAAEANRMRHEPTPMEAKLWEYLKPLGFEAQVMVCGKTKNGGWWQYILDFLDPSGSLVVEVDGSSHRTKKGRDRRRDKRLLDEGFYTLRFANKEVENKIDVVMDTIKAAL